MKPICDYVPEPRPASTELIVAAHYYPAWKRGAAELHNGFFDIADYPERTPLLGCYDEDNPEVTDWEIKWALEHGVNCFVYCWYRRKENEHRQVTRGALRLGHGIYDGFFRARYGEMMRFAIMYEASERWAGTDRADLLENLMPFWLDEYFTKPNYLVVDNKPVLFVYDYQRQIENAFPTRAAQAEAFRVCGELARERGFDGMTFAVEYRYDDMARAEVYRECGYDFMFSYCWHTKQLRPTQEEILEAQRGMIALRAEKCPDFFVPTASCMWDPAPRFKSMPDMYRESEQARWVLEPDNWRELLHGTREVMNALPENAPGRKMIMLDNWNEWDEGHFIAPSAGYGFRYLEAAREELTARDNLPDYRPPSALGLGSYDDGWKA